MDIDEVSFCVIPGCRTINKVLAKKKTLYSEFAFDRVSRDVAWWALRKLGVEEWLVKIVQLMYGNARSRHLVTGPLVMIP